MIFDMFGIVASSFCRHNPLASWPAKELGGLSTSSLTVNEKHLVGAEQLVEFILHLQQRSVVDPEMTS